MFRDAIRPVRGGRPAWIAVGILVVLLSASAVRAQQPAAPAGQAQQVSNARVFPNDAGMILNFIKPDKVADFEMVMGKLKEALAKSENPQRKQQAEGWKVFKTDLPGPQGAVTYFAIVDPVLKGSDYNMRQILTDAFGVADTNTIYKLLADSVAGQQLVAMTLTLSMK